MYVVNNKNYIKNIPLCQFVYKALSSVEYINMYSQWTTQLCSIWLYCMHSLIIYLKSFNRAGSINVKIHEEIHVHVLAAHYKAEHRRIPRDFYPLHLTDSNPVGPDDERWGNFIKVFHFHRNMILLSNPNRRIATFTAFPYLHILLPVWHGRIRIMSL